MGDGDEVADGYIHSTVKKDGMRVPKTALTRCAPQSTPIQPSLRLNRPPADDLEARLPPDLALEGPRALGPLVIVTSLIGSTGLGPMRHRKIHCIHAFEGEHRAPEEYPDGKTCHGSYRSIRSPPKEKVKKGEGMVNFKQL